MEFASRMLMKKAKLILSSNLKMFILYISTIVSQKISVFLSSF